MPAVTRSRKRPPARQARPSTPAKSTRPRSRSSVPANTADSDTEIAALRALAEATMHAPPTAPPSPPSIGGAADGSSSPVPDARATPASKSATTASTPMDAPTPSIPRTVTADIDSHRCRRMLPLQTTGARHEKVKRTGASAQGVSSNYTQKKRVTFQGKAAAPLKKRRTTAQRARDDLLLHRRFLHASDRRLRATAMSEGVIGLEFTGAQDTADCSCQLSNAIKARFASEKRERATVPGGRVYTDLKTVKVRSTAGFRYMCCFVDDYSRHGKIYFLKKKSDFMRDALKPYLQYLSQHSITLKILHSDCGGEYVSDETVAFLKSRNISPEYSPPHCQSLNGVAEVFWREIMKMTRYAIHDQQRPLSMWPAGAKLSETIRNSLITKAVPDVPPLVAFLDKEIDVSHLRVPLCDAFPYIEKHNRAGDGGTDLDRRRATMIYVGNDDDSRSYRLWDPKTERVYSRRYADVLFAERPKAQQKTPTTQTAHPTDVQIFHEEAADELTAEPGSTTSSAAAENTSKSAEQQNDQGSFSHGNSAPFPSV